MVWRKKQEEERLAWHQASEEKWQGIPEEEKTFTNFLKELQAKRVEVNEEPLEKGELEPFKKDEGAPEAAEQPLEKGPAGAASSKDTPLGTTEDAMKEESTPVEKEATAMEEVKEEEAPLEKGPQAMEEVKEAALERGSALGTLKPLE